MSPYKSHARKRSVGSNETGDLEVRLKIFEFKKTFVIQDSFLAKQIHNIQVCMSIALLREFI